MAGSIHGARASDSRTLHDGINTGWAGANSNAAVSNVAGSQEVVMTTSGGLGEAETGGVMLNIIPARRREHVQRHLCLFRRQQRHAGETTTPTRSRLPSQVAAGTDQSVGSEPDGRRPDQARQTLVLCDLPRGVRREHDSRHVHEQERRAIRPNGLSIPTQSRPGFTDSVTKNGIGRLTWQASPRNKISRATPNSTIDRTSLRRLRNADTRSAGDAILHTGHIQTVTWTSPFTNRLLLEAAWGPTSPCTPRPRLASDGTHTTR